VAASREIVDYLKASSSGLLYHNSLSPVVTCQVAVLFSIWVYILYFVNVANRC
jgi:7-keto-8-aminopelargonate synthetase-like enzyme